MPQLEVSSYLSQIFWLAISLGLLYGFLAHSFIPRLKESFNLRDKEMERLIRETKSLHEQAKAQTDEYQSHSNDLQNQLLSINKDTEEQCKQYLASQMEILKDIFDARKNELLVSLEQAQISIDEAMHGFVSETSEILVQKIKSKEGAKQLNDKLSS